MSHRLRLTLVFLVLATDITIAAAPPDPLAGKKPPATPGLLNGSNPIVVDRKAAIQLGKALFWDMNTGSDGMACGSCHFHAGVDRRTRNQLNSGQRHSNAATATTFEISASGAAGGPDYQLKSTDFPFHQFSNPASRDSTVQFSTDDVVGSAGTFLREFIVIDDVPEASNDQCSPASDPIFHLSGYNTRRVTDRNAPSVFNAAFNFRNFWDGRANNLFNGESPYGARDANAGVWVTLGKGQTIKQRLLLKNASLASLAVAPPLNDIEMSCAERRFLDIARKLLQRRPLERQAVHPEDSVLGPLRLSDGKGLDITYGELIRRAFAKRYWSAERVDAPQVSDAVIGQMEANFGFFFGLAIQLYEQTLISDQSLFDTKRDADNVPIAFDAQQRQGLDLFMNNQCVMCHSGPTFSAAAHPQLSAHNPEGYLALVNRSGMFEELDGVDVALTLTDIGFLPTSVAPVDQDIGLAAKDPYGNPLSFSEQYVASLADPNRPMVDPIKVVACKMSSPFRRDFASNDLIPDPNGKGLCRRKANLSKIPSPSVVASEMNKSGQGRIMTTVKAAFKIPSLRNVELTGPYMHNGSMKSLEEVIEFYDRGGNGFNNPQHPETIVFQRGFTAAERAALVAFLKTLTDERVRWERAPFDHPELSIPDGHDDQATSQFGAGYAADRFLHIPAVGKNGRTEQQGPLMPFETYLNF